MSELATRRRFTVDEYHWMVRVGILQSDDRVELIEGEIVQMSPTGNRHAACVDRLTERFVTGARGRAIVRIQSSIRLDRHSQPQPDVALLKPRPDFYGAGHPTPADILLIVEVAETTQDYDRGPKRRLYAAAGIVEYWIVDLAAGRIEIYRDPSGDGYRHESFAAPGESVAPAALPDLSLDVAPLLGL